MKKILVSLALLLSAIPVYAGPTTPLGGKRLSADSAHYAAVGWPSLSYEWWQQGGNMDWAIGAELVYGDWSGEFSDVDIGLALNVPMKWHISRSGRADVGFKFAPGGLIGGIDAPGSDIFVGAFRAEMALPISIDMNDRINLLTGVSAPVTVMFVESVDPYVILPIMPRIGVEFAAESWIAPFMLLEMGPVIAVGDFGAEVEFGIRASIGSVFF
ncbi:MAG: hypothetical protein IT286_01510 [Proteobacteria bacterium]|nr:hypothetical protein [Pseudomonadota bacterium]